MTQFKKGDRILKFRDGNIRIGTVDDDTGQIIIWEKTLSGNDTRPSTHAAPSHWSQCCVPIDTPTPSAEQLEAIVTTIRALYSHLSTLEIYVNRIKPSAVHDRALQEFVKFMEQQGELTPELQAILDSTKEMFNGKT